MAENKTKPTAASVARHIAAIPDEERRADCQRLIEIMSRATGQRPKLWGPSIVGFGSYHYRYDSGREGDMCVTGFGSRKDSLSIYLVASGRRQNALLARLGRHRMGKACLYVRRLADIDIDVLGQLIEDSVAEVRRRYP